MLISLENRKPYIDRILRASTKECPAIREIVYLMCSDGKPRSCFGIPSNVTVNEPYERVGMGFCYVDSINGTTYGKRHASIEDAQGNWAVHQLKQCDEFRAILETCPNERFVSQVAYWLKQDISILAEPLQNVFSS